MTPEDVIRVRASLQSDQERDLFDALIDWIPDGTGGIYGSRTDESTIRRLIGKGLVTMAEQDWLDANDPLDADFDDKKAREEAERRRKWLDTSFGACPGQPDSTKLKVPKK